MLFPEKDHHALIALGENATRLRQRGADKQYAEAINKINAKHHDLVCRFPHLFRIQGER